MSNLKNITISDKYRVNHFIESTSFCDIYTAQEQEASRLITLSVYNASRISRDDLDQNGDLREIGFLKLGIEGFPKLMGFGNFSHNMEKYRYIATEFRTGESVLDRMKRNGPLNEFDATIVVDRLSEIANRLHNREKPILLNGLSLNNIMFDMSDDTEKISLRNLINVRYFEDDFKYTYTDGVLPNNLAQECYNDVFTASTDQYNICALFYQMMHGVAPWHDDVSVDLNNRESIDTHLEHRNYQLKFSDSIDDHLRVVILRALNTSSDERFRNITDFIKYLKREKIVTSPGKPAPKKPKVKVGNGFKDIAGMDDLKIQLQTQVLDVLRRPDHFKKYGVSIPNGMLLYGPPGCGKTFISEKFCEEAAFSFFLIKPSDLSSIYVSGGEEKIGQLFTEAENNSPSVICFDEVDAIMPKRDGDSNPAIKARVNEFLAQINKCSERGIFIIATTNKPNIIDSAMLRTGRLEIQLFVSPPDIIAREKLFELYLKNRYCEIEINCKELAKLTEGIVASDVEFIVNKSSHKAAMLDVRISMDIIKEILSSFTPSVSKDEIDMYTQEHLSFINTEDTPGRRSIGY